MWSASIAIPTVLKDLAEPWVAFLISLRGQYGTFLLGDPNHASPQGTASSATITGSTGDRSVTVSMTGTLKAGDYFQLGSGSSARLHKVLVDQSGGGTLEIWPAQTPRVYSGSLITKQTGLLETLAPTVFNLKQWRTSNVSYSSSGYS